MATDEQMRALVSRMRSMSDAELSILQAVEAQLGQEGPISLTTSPGSANDLLWSEMVKLGWMSEAKALDVAVPNKVFTVAADAKAPLASLLAEIKRGDAIVKAINALRAGIPPQVIDAVHAADGTPADLAMMLGAIVESTMRRAIKPDLHDQFLAEVTRQAQQMRSL